MEIGAGARASILVLGLGFGMIPPAAAQQQQAQQQGGQAQQAQNTDWSYALTPKLYVDGWTGKRGPNGYQFSEFVELSGSRENLWRPGDSLSVSVEVGAIQNRSEDSDVEVNTFPSDTTLDISYSNFDNKTSGITGSIFFNLPTGDRDLSAEESRAVPNEDLVSHIVGGEGFNGGFDLRHHWQREAWHYFIGGGYVYRASFDRGVDGEVDGGHEITASVGGDKQLDQRTNAGLILEYSQLVDLGNGSGGNFALTTPLAMSFERTSLEVSYTLSISTETDLLTDFQRNVAGFDDEGRRGFDREGRYFRGIHHTVALNVAHDLTQRFALTGLVEGVLGNTDVPDDPTYFPTRSRYAVGLGSIAQLTDNLKFEAQVRFFQIKAENAAHGRTRFTGQTAFAALQYSF